MSSTDFAAWAQAITGLGTLCVAYATFRTQLKIKTLTHVVLELQTQSQLISERFELEKELTLRERFPDFEVTNFFLRADGVAVIELMNRGRYATSFAAINRSNFIHELNIVDYSDIGENKKLSMLLSSLTRPSVLYDCNFSFTLMYKNGNGIWFAQDVVCPDGQIAVTPQTGIPITS
jgi:hypothetical protein